MFIYYLTLDEERVIAEYTRIINGFRTDERIVINGYNGENGNVSRDGGIYTEDTLAKIPNIGEALANMKLSELNPPHIEIAEGMSFSHSNASGVYRMVDGKVYGIIRVMWYYKYPDISNAYQKDDMYYLYDENGNGKIVERDELREVIGDDYFIQRFSYCGFYYFANDDLQAVLNVLAQLIGGADTDIEFTADGNGYIWRAAEGDNSLYIEKIDNNLYYYYQSY